jgi:hypothetical protein
MLGLAIDIEGWIGVPKGSTPLIGLPFMFGAVSVVVAIGWWISYRHIVEDEVSQLQAKAQCEVEEFKVLD